MKILAQTRAVQEAMQLVTAAVPSNATRPVLLCVRLQAGSEGLSIDGTDLDVAMSCRVDEVQVEEAGHAVIPAVRLAGILRELVAEQVEISTDAQQKTLILRAGSSLFKIPLEFVEEFPTLEFAPPAPVLRVQRENMLRGLRLAMVAAARDATRFQMHSVLFDCQNDGKLRLVSTDGKRMAVAEIPGALSSPDLQKQQYIVPLKGVDLLLRVLASEAAEEVEIHLDQAEITYGSDRVSLSCKLVEGRFPDYERAIPTELGAAYELPCAALTVALRQASLMTTKETHSVLFSFQDSQLILSTKASSIGESRVEVAVHPQHVHPQHASPQDGNLQDGNLQDGVGQPFSINFNPTYLIDLLKTVDRESIASRFKDQKTAGLFTFDDGQIRYRHIVMPLVTHD